VEKQEAHIKEIRVKMELLQRKMETDLLIANLLKEEKETYHSHYKIQKQEDKLWRLKSRNLWHQERDKNTKFFHK
jgi:hypothetical protein